MLSLLFNIFSFFQNFYTIKLINWNLISTYSSLLFLGEIYSPPIQEFIEGLTNYFSIIYCSEADSSFNNNFNTGNSSLEESIKNSDSANSSPSKSLPAVTINHNVTGLHSLGEGITLLGKALTNYVPLAAITAAGFGTSTILKSLPPTHRVGIALTTTGIMVGSTFISQGINYLYQNGKEGSKLLNNTSPEEGLPFLKKENENLKEIEETLTSSIIDSDLINSSLERINSENDLLLAIIIFGTSGLYALISLTISLLIKEFSPENHPFLTARPRLLKYFKFLANSNKISIAILIFLIAVTFLLILISANYLRIYSFNSV